MSITTSAMHRVLCTRELLDIIFEHVDTFDIDNDKAKLKRRIWLFHHRYRSENSASDRAATPESTSYSKRTMLSLAIVSKYFSPSALRLIWHSLHSLWPLLETIPDDVLVEVPQSIISKIRGTKDMSVGPCTQEEHFARLRFYASYVHEFGTYGIWEHKDCFDPKWDHSPTPIPKQALDLSETVVRLLPFFPSSRPLFPYLTSATLPVNLMTQVEGYTELVLGKNASVDRLCIDLTGKDLNAGDADAGQWVECVDQVATADLKRLKRFEVGRWDMPVYDSAYSTPCPFGAFERLIGNDCAGRLTHLRIGAFVIEERMVVSRDLATLPNLEYLNVNLSGLTELGKFPPTGSGKEDSVCFPALKTISIKASHPQPLLDLFEHWKPCALDIFHVERQSRNHFWDIEALFDALQKSLPATSLQTIAWMNNARLYHDSDYGAQVSDITPAVLRSLAYFARLTHFAIRLEGSVTFGDEHLQEVDGRWDGLRRFLIYERELTRMPRITPNGIVRFLRSHKHLEQLTLRFDATTKVSNYPPIIDIPAHNALKRLDVCTSNADDPGVLFEFLRYAVPKLEELEFGWRYSDGDLGLIDLEFESWEDEWRAEEGLRTWTEVRERFGFEEKA